MNKYRNNPLRKKFNFELPEELEQAIDEFFELLEQNSCVDCGQENIRAIAHVVLDEEKSQEVINYYYRRRWW